MRLHLNFALVDFKDTTTARSLIDNCIAVRDLTNICNMFNDANYGETSSDNTEFLEFAQKTFDHIKNDLEANPDPEFLIYPQNLCCARLHENNIVTPLGNSNFSTEELNCMNNQVTMVVQEYYNSGICEFKDAGDGKHVATNFKEEFIFITLVIKRRILPIEIFHTTPVNVPEPVVHKKKKNALEDHEYESKGNVIEIKDFGKNGLN